MQVGSPLMSKIDSSFVPTVKFEDRSSERERIAAQLAAAKQHEAQAAAAADQLSSAQELLSELVTSVCATLTLTDCSKLELN